jgi:hypothetical protein
MTVVTTRYMLRGVPYHTAFYARPGDDITLMLHQRQMGETLIVNTATPPLLASECIAQWRWSEALHALCWLGMVGGASGRLTARELMDDDGVIHSLAHIIAMDPIHFVLLTNKVRYLILLAYWRSLWAERRVPGFIRPEEDGIATTSDNKAIETIEQISQAVRVVMPVWWERNNPDAAQI